MADRTASGRFAPGNAGGPGRPRRVVEVDYLRRLSDKVDMATWDAVIDKAIEQAKTGDVAARAWLSRHLCGAATLDASLTTSERLAALLELG